MAEFLFAPSVHDERGKGLEAVLARLGSVDPTVIQTMHLATVISGALTDIAWGFDMLGPLWDTLSTTAAKRAYLLDLYQLQGRRGTPWSVKTAMTYLGWPGCTIGERQNALYYNGVANYDGYYWYGVGPSNWWEWFLTIPLNGASYTQATHAVVQGVATYYAPFRSRLVQTTLNLGTIQLPIVGAPTWGGAGYTKVAVSANGTTGWASRAYRRVTAGPGANEASVEFRIASIDAIGMAVHYFALMTDAAAVSATVNIPLIEKSADMELVGTLHVTW